MKVIFAPHYIDNPYQEKLSESLLSLGHEVIWANRGPSAFFKTPGLDQAEVIHFHWLEPYIQGRNVLHTIFKISLFLFKIRPLKGKRKFVWTVHNVKNHESKYLSLERFFIKKFLSIIDIICVHNVYSKTKLISEYNIDKDKIYIIPHANYVDAYPKSNPEKVLDLRRQRGIDEKKLTFMFLGRIRPYKGVLDLIKAFKELNLGSAQLVICGVCKIKNEQKVIEEEIKGIDNIYFIPQFIDSAELSNYISLANVMVYPYRDISTSGALILGMSYKKLCLASNVGSIPEFIDNKYLFEDFTGLKKAMKDVSGYSEEDLLTTGEKNYAKIRKETWAEMASLTSELYKNKLPEKL